MFSIIIPLYNKSLYIKKVVNSVLNQNCKNFELIIVNDGSTDDSLEIIKKFKDDRIIIINQSNLGVSVARNNGVKIAKNDNIIFLDADDWWDENFLTEMQNLIYKYNEAVLFSCNYFSVKNGVNRKALIGVDSDFKDGYIDYFKVYSSTFWAPINCSYVTVKKNIFNAVSGFNPILKFGEDLDLWIRIAINHKVAYVNKYLVYSNQDVPVSHRALGNKYWDVKEHVIFNLEYLGIYEIKNKELKELLDGLRVRSLIDFYLNNNHFNDVQRELSKVDFAKQPKYYQFIYKFPKVMVKLFFFVKNNGSFLKQQVIKLFQYLKINE